MLIFERLKCGIMVDLNVFIAQASFEALPYGVVYQDLEGAILKFNQEALDILGLTRDQLMGKTSIDPGWRSVRADHSPFPGEEHPAMQVLKSGKSVSNVIMGVNNLAAGHRKWIRINSRPLFENDKLQGVVSFFEDITESVDNENELTFSRRVSNFLLKASKTLNQASAEDFDPVLEDLLQEFHAITGVDRCYLRCFQNLNPNSKALWTVLSQEGLKTSKQEDSEVFNKILDWCYQQEWNTSRILVDANNEAGSNELKELLSTAELEGFMACPMINSKGEASGFLAIAVMDQERFSFDPGVLKAIEFFADLLSSFFDRQKSFWSLRERIKELQCIYNVSQIIVKQGGIDFNFLQESVDAITEGFLVPEATRIELIANNIKYRSKDIGKPIGNTYKAELSCPSMGLTYLKACLAEGLEFLPEERVLIDRLADMLQTEMQRRAFVQRLEESNERYRIIAKSESIYFLRVDLEGNLIACSEKYLEDFEWAFQGEDPKGKSITNTISDYHLPKVAKMVEECLRRPGTVVKGEIDKPKSDGKSFSTFWEFKALKNAVGELSEIQCIGLDVSAVKKAEGIADRFKTASDQSSNGAVLTDAEGNIEYVNSRFCELSGFSESELIGKNGFFIFHEDFFPQREVLLARLSQEGALRNEVVKVKFASGTSVDVLLNALVGAKEGESYVYYSLVDITNRLEQEKKILEQNTRLEAILKSLPNQIFVNSVQGEYLEYYPGFNSQDQRDLDFLIGRNIKDILPINIAEPILKLIRDSVENQEMKSLSYKRTINGEERWFEAIISPLDANKVLRFVRDVTIQKEYEEQLLRFNIAIHQSPVGIVIADLNGAIEYASPSNKKISGYDPEDLLGLSTRVFASGKTSAAVYKEMWSNLLAGEIWEGELLNKNKAGEEYWERLSITPMKGPEGEITRYMALKQNIDQERRFKENLMRQNEIFREISNTQSHDVRGPIARLLGITEFIQQNEVDEKEMREFIEGINSSAQELDQITRKIVGLSAAASSLELENKENQIAKD